MTIEVLPVPRVRMLIQINRDLFPARRAAPASLKMPSGAQLGAGRNTAFSVW
jgi:hypothetical protein